MKLLPDSIKFFLVNRLFEIAGLVSISFSLFILLSLTSYSYFDQNILNLSSYEISNVGGYLGASVSEILLQFFGFSSYLFCIIFISWSYKLFFTKQLELFALNILLLPFAALLISILLEISNLGIENGFVATQLISVIDQNNILSENYLFYAFFAVTLFTFFVTFYFTMALNLSEWKAIFNFVLKLFKILKTLIIKLLNLRRLNIFSFNTKQISSQKIKTEKGLEPKIDFEALRGEAVSTYDNDFNKQKIVEHQNEILFDDNSYKKPDINFLSKPDNNKENIFNQNELDLNAEKLKNVLTDFKIEGDIIRVSPGPIVTMYE